MNPKLALAIGIVCIAFSPIFVKMAGAPAVTSGFYRLFIGWLLLAPYCIIKQKAKLRGRDLLLALLAGAVFASDIAVWNTSILMISATVSTLLANLAPVWVGLMSWIFLRKRSGWLFWLGTFIAISGMVVLVGYQNLARLKFNGGIVLAVTASLLYSIYIMITKRVLAGVDTLSFMFYSMLGAVVTFLGISLFKGDDLIRFSLNTWLCFLGMGAVCQLAGWLTINYAISKLPATKTAVALLGQTVMTAIFAAFLLHEHLAFREVAGCVIVLAGIAISFF